MKRKKDFLKKFNKNKQTNKYTYISRNFSGAVAVSVGSVQF